MEPLVERCCGLDIHQKTVVACLLIGAANKRPTKEVRTYGTMTADLKDLRDWLKSQGCIQVGMESTGIYWTPIYQMLEGSFELIVGNAQHIKNVPGRKTDVKDSEWIAELTRHGLIAKSFVPPKAIRELRDLTRYRRKLVETRSAERNRLLKLLETAQIKLASVASDVFGVSGMRMLRALLQGETDSQKLAELAKGKLRKKLPDLARALEGHLEEHHRFVLGTQLHRLEMVQQDIEGLEQRILDKLGPYQDAYRALQQIPGLDQHLAAVLIAELGVDMSVFLSARHLVSWAGVCPGNNQSAGKRKGGKRRQGNVHLTTALYEAAKAAAKKKGSYYKDKYHRLRARRGNKRAAIAIGRKLLLAAYHMLSEKQDYRELGQGYLDGLAKARVATNLVRRLERLGYEVDLKSKEASKA